MSATNDPFKSFPNIPLKLLTLHLPKPSFYPKNSNSIIISTCYNNTHAGVFKYDLDSNGLEMLQQYGNIAPTDHGQFIDYNNDTLHLLDGDQQTHHIMDLKTKIINIKPQFDCGPYPKAVEISTKTHEIHVIADFAHHFQFQEVEQEEEDFTIIYSNICQKPSESDYYNFGGPSIDPLHDLFDIKLLYDQNKEQIMILGARGKDNIYYYNIKEPNQWKLMNIKMPHIVERSEYYDVLLFCDIIMVFYFDGY
eukprot:66422_1